MSEFLPWNAGTIKRFLSKIGSAVHCLGILSVLRKLLLTLSVLWQLLSKWLHREWLHDTGQWYSGIYILKLFLKLESQNIPITCFQALSFIFPCQPSPVLVSPLTIEAVRELLGASKCSSDLWVEFATTGLYEWDKSRSTKKPCSGFEKVMGTGVTGISSSGAASMLALCPYGGGQRLPGPVESLLVSS